MTSEKRVSMAIRITPELHTRLKQAADDRMVSPNLIVTRAVIDFLDNIRTVEEVLGMRGSAVADLVEEIKVGGTD